MTTLTGKLRPEARARLELLAKHWSLSGEHPLAALQDESLGSFRLVLLLGPTNNVGSRYFQLLLTDADGRLSEEALALGLHNSGHFPAYNWLELTRYEPRPRFDHAARDLAEDNLDLELFRLLSRLVPPGGHIMVEYDSPSQRATERILTLGYPSATSPLGYRLFQVGCRSYRDWYISEGGREGPRKLQAFKPLNKEIARDNTATLRGEVSEVLARPDSGQHGEWGEIARRNAAAVLEALNAGLADCG